MTRLAVWYRRHEVGFFRAWVAAFTAAVGWALWHGYDVDQREAREEVVEAAQRCVDSWDVRENIRDAVEGGTRGGARVGAEALIGIVTDARPEQVDQYLSLIDHAADVEVAAARAEIPDPDCDLDDARRQLD